MKTKEYIMIDSRDIILEELEDSVWKFAIDGNFYYINSYINEGKIRIYDVTRENSNPSFPADDGPYYDSIFTAQFDNPFKAMRFILDQII